MDKFKIIAIKFRMVDVDAFSITIRQQKDFLGGWLAWSRKVSGKEEASDLELKELPNGMLSIKYLFSPGSEQPDPFVEETIQIINN